MATSQILFEIQRDLAQFLAKLDLKYLKQQGSVEEYINKFNSITSNSRLSEEFKVEWFLHGLKAEISLVIGSLHPSTIREAMHYARLQEELVEVNKMMNLQQTRMWNDENISGVNSQLHQTFTNLPEVETILNNLHYEVPKYMSHIQDASSCGLYQEPTQDMRVSKYQFQGMEVQYDFAVGKGAGDTPKNHHDAYEVEAIIQHDHLYENEDEISLAISREKQDMTHVASIDGVIFEGSKIGTYATEFNPYSVDSGSLDLFGQVAYQPVQDDNGEDGPLEKIEDVTDESLIKKDKEAIDVNEVLVDFCRGTWSPASSSNLSFGSAMAFSIPAFSFVSCHHSENDEVSDFSFFSNKEIIDKIMDEGVIIQHENVPCVITGRRCFYPFALCQPNTHDPFIGGSIVARTSILVSFGNMKEANGHLNKVGHIFEKSEGSLGNSCCAFDKFGKEPSPTWIRFSCQRSGAIPYEGIYCDPTKEEWYLFEHFQAEDHLMPSKHVGNHHKLESGCREKAKVDFLRNSTQPQKLRGPQIKELEIYLVNALQLSEFLAKWPSGQMVEDCLVFEYMDLTLEDIAAQLKLGNFHFYEIHGSDYFMNRATYLQKSYNQHPTGSRIQHFRGHLKIESIWVEVSAHIIMPTSENENKTSMKASRKEEVHLNLQQYLITNHPIPEHSLGMQFPYGYLGRIFNGDHMSCLNSRQHIWLLPFSIMFGSSSSEEISKASFNIASDPIEFKEQRLGQKEVKILKTLMILIWGWYYQDYSGYFKERMKKFKLMFNCSFLNQHPGQWMLQWMIAWVQKLFLSCPIFDNASYNWHTLNTRRYGIKSEREDQTREANQMTGMDCSKQETEVLILEDKDYFKGMN